MLGDPGEELRTFDGGLRLADPHPDSHPRRSLPSLTTNTFSIPPPTVTSSR